MVGASTHGCWLGTYEPEAQAAFARLIREGDVVYDVGANAGFFTLLAAKLAGERGTVYAFEPFPRNVSHLRRHLQLNGVNATVLDVALSSKSGTARFASAAHASMGKLDTAGDLEVHTETVDELVRTGRILPPSFIKMDVEGAEYDVLRGAADTLSRHRPPMLLSTHGSEVHGRCCTFLAELGYRFETVRDGSVDGQYTVVATAS